MSPITENTPQSRDFQNDLPLHPAARELLQYFFDSGWPDPTKIHQQSSDLRNRIGIARESIAGNLGIATTELEIVGELGFGFQVALGGLLTDFHSHFVFSEIDRQVIHALARIHQRNGGSAEVLKPDRQGRVDYNALSAASNSVLSWQSTNREVGVRQESPAGWDGAGIFADMTATFPLNELPPKWDSALWDPRSFGGPQGIALVGISDHGRWRNPGPELDKRRVYGSFSKPLFLATAVALENWVKTSRDDFNRLAKLNAFARHELTRQLPSIRIASTEQGDPRFLAFVLPNVIAEELLRKVEKFGFLIDAGSACGGGALAPSHVLAAMGFSADGNFRISLKPHHDEEVISELCQVLVKGVAAGA